MMQRLVRPLDRYVFSEFWRIFMTTALGFPLLVIIIDLTDNLDTYLDRNLPKSSIALSYLYWLPDSMFMVLPAAVLFATVFSIGSFTRHSEITAAKASGMSFHRFSAPIYVGAIIAAMLGLLLAEVVPATNARRQELLQAQRHQVGNDRYNFAYAAEGGRIYKVGSLNVSEGIVGGIEIERPGSGPAYPTYVIAASGGQWTGDHGWVLRSGNLHILPDTATDLAFAFDSVLDRRITQRPVELTASAKAPEDMGWRELGRFIAAMERSGGDVNKLKVDRMLKLAIPITCVIIAMFGAPLATSTQRGGAAYGVGISLATTVVFLVLIQLTRAIGEKGIVTPNLAAWIPSAIFFFLGTILLLRVRT